MGVEGVEGVLEVMGVEEVQRVRGVIVRLLATLLVEAILTLRPERVLLVLQRRPEGILLVRGAEGIGVGSAEGLLRVEGVGVVEVVVGCSERLLRVEWRLLAEGLKLLVEAVLGTGIVDGRTGSDLEM